MTFFPPLLYIWTSIWQLRTPNAGQESHFQHFFVLKSLKKMQKEVTNLEQNLRKNVFLILHQYAGRVFYSQKMLTKRWSKYTTPLPLCHTPMYYALYTGVTKSLIPLYPICVTSFMNVPLTLH